jgi:hypothetical protein
MRARLQRRVQRTESLSGVVGYALPNGATLPTPNAIVTACVNGRRVRGRWIGKVHNSTHFWFPLLHVLLPLVPNCVT